MAPIGTVYGPTANARNYKVRIAAQLAGVEVASTPDFQFGVDNQTPEYLAKNPSGKVPAFVGADGYTLYDSSAIAMYLASKGANSAALLGQTEEERGQVLQYVFFAESDLMPAVAGTLYPVLGFRPMIKPAHQAAEEQLVRLLGVLNNVLLDKTYLVGERLTIADVIVAADLLMVFEYYLTAEDRKQFRNLTRYFKTIAGQTAFKAVAGQAKLCTERAQAAAPAKKEKKEKKEQQPKPAKKAEKKAEKEVDEEEEEEAPAPKPKSKLDL
ncbi:Elongation factor 1-gamma, partial [Coemansia nantahalensis]